MNGRVVDAHAPFLHELFKLPIAQRVRHVPGHAREDDVLCEMGPLEAHHAPSRLTLGWLCTISRFWTLLMDLHRYKLINSMLHFEFLCKAPWVTEGDHTHMAHKRRFATDPPRLLWGWTCTAG